MNALGKRNLLLVLLLAVLGLADFATRPKARVVRETVPLLEAWPAGSVARLSVTDTAMAGATPLELRREEGIWRLPALGGFPARASLVQSLLDGLASLNTLDRLSGDAASHAGYGLDESSGVHLVLADATGANLADLWQGDLAAGGRASYVRRSGEPAVYRAPLFHPRVQVDPLRWIDARWMPLDPELLGSVRIERKGGETPLELALEAGSASKWLYPDGKAVPAADMRRLLAALSRVTITSIESSAATPADPDLRFEVRIGNDEPWRGALWIPAEGEPATATVEREGSWTLKLAPSATRALLQATDAL
ncbi:MAG: DUF4340 domain-containing protein [Planctomycetota bacterium]